MILHVPLVLKSAKTEAVQLVPTKNFFKPVVVLTAAVSIEDARILNAAYLYDDKGTPHRFEGTHKLHGDLAGAHVLLKGSTMQQTIKAEKVAHFGLSIEEKIGMQLRVRIHVPEGEEKLQELLHFLATLNKGSFEVTIADQQGSMVAALNAKLKDKVAAADAAISDPDGWPLPDDEGHYDMRRATLRPFKKGRLSAALSTIECVDGFRSGWSMTGDLKTAGTIGVGVGINVSNAAHGSENAALEAAATELLAHIEQLNIVEGPDAKLTRALDAWVYENVPGLTLKGATIQ